MTRLDRAWLDANPLPLPERDTDKNKRGRALIAGGSESVSGALLLTGEAAFRAGAGKVQLATVVRAALGLGLRMPEAATFALATNENGELAGAAGAQIAGLARQCDTLILGPGMGPDADTAALFEALVSQSCGSGSLVLDAAMIPVATQLETTRAWAGRRVLTPHHGEMAALMACDPDAVTRALASDAAKKFGATVVLKAAETWIASPDGAALHYSGGGPGLATGGSGDVLAGIIGGLLARGAQTEVAAAWGVWLHGEAGRKLADKSGSLGFLARELLPLLPPLLNVQQRDK